MLHITLLSLLSLLLLISSIHGEMSPSYPEPGTVWKTGKSYKISWDDDDMKPHMKENWRKFKIDFMTGDNNNQKFLKNVVKGLDASKVNEYEWIAPDVEPHSAIYFLMFTNEKGENAWTTRFGIAGEDGVLDKPEKSVQSNGDAIPWGIGKLKGPVVVSKSKPNQTYSMTPAMSSAQAHNAAVVIPTSDSSRMNMYSVYSLIAIVALYSITQ